jgi:hypothetical protein
VITEQVRFFYSTNGTDVHGPVTEDALRLLIQTQVLGPESFVCREGESEWKPCNFDLTPRGVTATEPYSPPAYVPTPEALERMKMPENEGPIPEFLTGIYVVLAVGGSGLLSLMNAREADSAQIILYRTGAFVAHLVIIALLPYLISWAFRLPLRNMIRVVGAATACAVLLLVHLHTQTLRMQAEALASNPATTAGSGRAIAGNGTGQDYMQNLKNSASGDTQEAKVARDLLAFQDALMEKVRASHAAEKLCDVDPTTITGDDDIDKRIANLTKLHDAQSDVIAYLKGYNDNCRQLMEHDNFEPSVVFNAIETSRKATHVDLLISLWKANRRLTDDHSARLGFLEKIWGHWSVKDGKVLFEKDEALNVYNAYGETLHEDVLQIADVQKQIGP